MKVLHTVAGLWTTTGGPAASVSGLCRELGERGHDVTLLTGAGPLAPEVVEAAERIRLRTVDLGPYRLANFSLDFRRACREEAADCRVIHTHGLWLYPNWASAAAARARGRPLVISPRGMLEPWSLSRSRWRKRLLWALVERRSFGRAALIHATSDQEAAGVRRLGIRTPIAVIPNGIDTNGEYSWSRIDGLRRTSDSGSVSPRVVLSLGRIHPKKGLDLLCDAWAGLGAVGAKLVICGGGEPAHVEWLERRLEGLDPDHVEYLGPVSGEPKLRLLARAALVVAPSRSENYGMVIAEALACATPVIASTATPWPAVAERRCGWWIEPSREALHAALGAALDLPARELEEMGGRGRALIEEEHSLTKVATMMESAYLWLTEAQQPFISSLFP